MKQLQRKIAQIISKNKKEKDKDGRKTKSMRTESLSSHSDSILDEATLDDQDEDFEDEEDIEDTKTLSKAGESHGRSFLKRSETHKSIKSNRSGKSRMSMESKWSGKSGKSMVSSVNGRKKSQTGFFSYGTSEEQQQEEKVHPFDQILGKGVFKGMKERKDYIEKMSFTEFKTIKWDYTFPSFVIDLVEFISGFSIKEFERKLLQKEEETKEKEEFAELVQRRKKDGDKIDEQLMMELYRKAQLTNEDRELEGWEIKTGLKMYNKLIRFFRGVSANPAEEKDSVVYLTQETLGKKMKNHFGHKCDFLSRRLYFFLSDNVSLKRILFLDFLKKMWFLWDAETDRRLIMSFAFKIYDIDNDGIIEGIDLLQAQDYANLNSKFGHEVLTLVDYFVCTHLKVKGRMNPQHIIGQQVFFQILEGTSTIVDELKLKIPAKPGKYSLKSVFIPLEQDIENTAGKRLIQINAPKRTILQRVGGGQHGDPGEKKKVTFAYVPAYKDDEERQQKKPRRIKDAYTDVSSLSKAEE